MMNNFTKRHLDRWINSQFCDRLSPEEIDDLTLGMVAEYDNDPEFYNNVGWWKVYDNVKN